MRNFRYNYFYAVTNNLPANGCIYTQREYAVLKTGTPDPSAPEEISTQLQSCSAAGETSAAWR
ncbi:hypothetical protein R1N_11300 [Enterobacter asburiae]|nr:hypothetical protein EAA2563_10560 [Enterobacter asburiae]BCP68943.1 hypothetical protein R1N_11300 [Enterobacter asburiae]